MSGLLWRRVARAALIVVSCTLGLAATASADYEETYRKGILALDAKRWQEAIRLLRQAADENPLEGGDPIQISGSRTEPYVPLYYIGLAYFRMGDCGRAGITWQLAKMGGEVLDHPQLAKAMREHVAACEGGKAGAEKGTETASAAAPAGAAAAGTSPRVQNLMKGARDDLAGKRFARAKQRAEEALTLGAAQADVDALLADVADAEAAAGRAGAAAPAAGAPAATAAVSPAGTASADAERQAMEAFFALDYGRARRLLEPLAGGTGLSARGHLYLACSIAAGALLSGQDVDGQLQRARAAYQKAQAGGVRFDPDWKYISPRLRSLLEGRGPS